MIEGDTERKRELHCWQVLAKLFVLQISQSFLLAGINNEQDKPVYTHTHRHEHMHAWTHTHIHISSDSSCIHPTKSYANANARMQPCKHSPVVQQCRDSKLPRSHLGNVILMSFSWVCKTVNTTGGITKQQVIIYCHSLMKLSWDCQLDLFFLPSHFMDGWEV